MTSLDLWLPVRLVCFLVELPAIRGSPSVKIARCDGGQACNHAHPPGFAEKDGDQHQGNQEHPDGFEDRVHLVEPTLRLEVAVEGQQGAAEDEEDDEPHLHGLSPGHKVLEELHPRHNVRIEIVHVVLQLCHCALQASGHQHPRHSRGCRSQLHLVDVEDPVCLCANFWQLVLFRVIIIELHPHIPAPHAGHCALALVHTH
mmetsp:Transcript_99941/g.238173  ORF Transcript_99941/g.238173 Transcript_99941/m.238173 type:complete len:201 (-) Transcript_99941:414-1016(-)